MTDAQSPPQPLPATPEVLAKVLERRPVLWVGEGVSVAAGHPSRSKLVEVMVKACDDPLDTSRPFYAVADAFVASMGRVTLAELLRQHHQPERPPTAAHRALARLARAGCFRAIVTTNHDRLVEQALREEGVSYEVLPPAPAVSDEVALYVLKLEGSFEDWVSITVSGRAQAVAGQDYPFLQDDVSMLLREEPVLFVGAGLSDPRLLRWIAALSEDEAADLKPWRALMRRETWDAALSCRYDDGGIERNARDALARARIRPLLLDSEAEVPGLLAEVADVLAPSIQAEPIMRFGELRLKDFRGFEDCKMAFPEERLAVLVGVNGAGKSTVLDGIALLLARFVREIRKLGDLPSPTKQDIRYEEKQAKLVALVEIGDRSQRWQLTVDPPERSASLHAGRREPAPGPVISDSGFDARDIQQRVLDDDEASVPLICYYPSSRAMVRQPLRDPSSRVELGQVSAYDQAFSSGPGPFEDFLSWFRFEEDYENEMKVRGEGSANPRLHAVRTAVERFMSTLPGGRFSNLRAERAAPSEASFATLEHTSLVIDKAGQPLALDQLSDGERTLLLLVADIARRLALANPGRPDPLSGSGIVLIDEIELHLHPAWQRAVIRGLRRTFPGIQFIIATHSPQVLSQVPAQCVILLDGFQVAGASPPTFGRDSNSILEEVMSVPARPREMAARLQAVGRLIDEERLEEARAALDEVAAVLGVDDTEVVRLRTLLSFMSD